MAERVKHHVWYCRPTESGLVEWFKHTVNGCDVAYGLVVSNNTTWGTAVERALVGIWKKYTVELLPGNVIRYDCWLD